MTKSLNAYMRWRFYKIFEKRLLEVAFNQQSAISSENPIFCGKLCYNLIKLLPKSHPRVSKSFQTLRGELEPILTHF